MKIDNTITSILAKQEYLFKRKLWLNLKLINKILDLIEKYSSYNIKDSSVEFLFQAGRENRQEELEAMDKNHEKYIASINTLNCLPSQKRKQFYIAITKIQVSLMLGIEWLPTLIVFIIEQVFLPPLYNLDMSIIRNNKDSKKLLLELNQNTSLKEIENAWNTIRSAQKMLWPNYKKVNFNKKAIRNLDIFIHDFLSRKEKITDMTRVGEIWLEEGGNISMQADRKRVAILRQVRHRLLKKS